MKLLKELCSIRSCSGDESTMRDFIVQYVKREKKNWACTPEIIFGNQLQDALILVFGKPTTAIYAHMDNIGFMVGYDNNLIKIGGPKVSDDYHLVGSDSGGEIEAGMLVIRNEEGHERLQCVHDRIIDRGTNLCFKPDFRETTDFIQSPYLDNRLGVWVALEVAKTMKNGAIVFSTYEEVSGNSVGFCAKFLLDRYAVRQALVCDITWVTEGVSHGNGVAISLRDSGIPRKSFTNRIVEFAKKSKIHFQLEVESAGGSDGTVLQRSSLPIDWCFIGAPEDGVHSPDEKVHKKDIEAMVEMYQCLMEKL